MIGEELQLESIVHGLLGHHNCVTIPNLGAFILRPAPASANPFNGEIKPSGESIFFNGGLKADDGVLANTIREKFGISYNTALEMLNVWVEDLKKDLALNHSQHFGKLGNFFLNNEKQVFFIPGSKLNLSPQAFGLDTITINSLNTQNRDTVVGKAEYKVDQPSPISKPDEAQVIEEAVVVEMQHEYHARSNSNAWKVAATIALITMAGASVYVLKRFQGTGNNNIEQASTVAPQEVRPIEKPAEIEKKSEEIIYPKEVNDINNKQSLLVSSKGNYYLQVGAFMSEKLAKLEMDNRNGKGEAAMLVKAKNSSLIRVVVGRFETAQEADAALLTLPESGRKSIIIKNINQAEIK